MTGPAHGSMRLWLRLEGLAVFMAAAYLYGRSGQSWGLFAALFFLPDVSFAGYLGGPRVGAAVYNLAHSYVSPVATAGVALAVGAMPAWLLIWLAHIGFDRTLGYGLKYPTAFGDTHLGRIGRNAPPE